jgi:hypothetical protein
MHTFQKYIQKLEELSENNILMPEQIKKHFENTPIQNTAKKSSNNFKGRNENYGNDLFDDVSKLEV